MKRKVFIFCSILFFIVFLVMYLVNRIGVIDSFVYDLVILLKSDFNTTFMKFITFFASTKFILAVLLFMLMMYIFKKKKLYLITVLLIVGEVVLNNIVKLVVRRDRPELINLVKETSYSFPSGHTMVSVVFYGFLIYLISKTKYSKKVKVILYILLVTLIFLIMMSRIYLGVHYFSDVFAGLFLGLAYLLIIITILERRKLL